MYKLNYYGKSTAENGETYKYKVEGEHFRLRRNALHYLFDIVQSDYREKGYATEEGTGCLICYKSEKTNEGNRKITEILIKVEK